MTTLNRKWALRFVALAQHIAEWSKDEATKVGAVVVGPDREIRATGYNGPPRGVRDTVARQTDRDVKLLYTVHAEDNAIDQAALIGVSLRGCTMYLSTLMPCAGCARSIIQAGITSVVVPKLDVPARWKESIGAGLTMFKEAGVEIFCLDAPVRVKRKRAKVSAKKAKKI
ncbi:MAG: CMP deaminase [Dehalococcoidia bacterium]|nr:MAG: CMP deaminase [Dehalococcoidia bacterium]